MSLFPWVSHVFSRASRASHHKTTDQMKCITTPPARLFPSRCASRGRDICDLVMVGTFGTFVLSVSSRDEGRGVSMPGGAPILWLEKVYTILGGKARGGSPRSWEIRLTASTKSCSVSVSMVPLVLVLRSKRGKFTFSAVHARLSLLEHMLPQSSYLPLRIIDHVRSVAKDHGGAPFQIIGRPNWQAGDGRIATADKCCP